MPHFRHILVELISLILISSFALFATQLMQFSVNHLSHRDDLELAGIAESLSAIFLFIEFHLLVFEFKRIFGEFFIMSLKKFKATVPILPRNLNVHQTHSPAFLQSFVDGCSEHVSMLDLRIYEFTISTIFCIATQQQETQQKNSLILFQISDFAKINKK